MKLGILATHPIQYYSPLYCELALRRDVQLTVFYAHRPTPEEQGIGFGASFEWDVPLLDGYKSVFLTNISNNPNTSRYDGCDTPEIELIIAREHFDAFLVLGWYVKCYQQAIRACRKTQTPLMVRGDSTLLMQRSRIRRFARWLHHRRMMKQFDAFLIVGEKAREYYLAFGADPRRMECSPHFVDNERFSQAVRGGLAVRSEFRGRWNVPAESVAFLFVGKYMALKRPQDFVRAVAAASKHMGKRVYGLMVGDGPMRDGIEKLIAKLDAPVQQLGFLNQTEIPNAYAAADVLVLPSETETWGLVVNEAMASGLTAIVSDKIGCAPDLVIVGQTGLIYSCGDVEALTSCMTTLASDHNLLLTLKRGASERIKAYCAAAAADGVIRAAEKLASCRRGVGVA